ncbi:MAG: SecY family transport protein, partial [Holophagales bacterium]|nr:SecY family transport protein [Holophagales bacterium]
MPLVERAPAAPEKPTNVVGRVVNTVLRLAVYVALGRLSVPILTRYELANPEDLRSVSIVALGVVPFVTGFLLVELFSLLTPWGRRVREEGFRGREKLSRWAMGCSVIVCMVQGLGVVYAMERLVTPSGLPLIADPGIVTRVLGVGTLVAGSTALYFLCGRITVDGIGNGFCLVFAVDLVYGAGRSFFFLRSESGSPESLAIQLIVVLAVAALFVGLLRRRGEYFLSGGEQDSPRSSRPRSRLPALPQGIVPVAWAYGLLSLPTLLGQLRGQATEEAGLGPVAYLVGLALAVPLLGFVTLHLFSSRARVERNLPDRAPAEGFGRLLGARFWQGTAALTLAVLVLGGLEIYLFAGHALLGAVGIVLLVAVGMDLIDDVLFYRRHADSAVLAELDNVHLAHLVEAQLAERGIPCRVKALHFRSLLYFLGPIYKMSVLVA